ncbi:transglycosylase domain-containing protein [Agrilactobacillus yilanensis]|uniref:Transglycosylase domain-containing protein n=1 Tax=Agrilactobacillus yilanensis TaxID=2485997 RepID=A0ABW4J8I0_9LACO|nr:PBP1A family penicillin-binding protein [Agrilactobacillus yilanensis]
MSAKRSKTPKGKKRHWFRTILITILGLILVGEIAFLLIGRQAPSLTQNKLQNGGSSVILDYQGNEVASLGDENRAYTTSDTFSTTLKEAVVSIEDRRFYQEPLGINPVRIVKAAVYNITHPNAPVQGGSTLTQQLVKLSVFSTKKSDQTFKRKIQEAYLTFNVERNYSKQQILEFYMNKVYLANGVYGMGTASDYYFNKKPKQLTLAQAALIAGLPQAPNTYDPYAHPEAAKQRRDQVINAMLANDKISQSEATAAINTPISDGLVSKRDLNQENNNRYVADNFIKEVINEVKAQGYDPYRDNLKIKTTLHLDVQKELYDTLNGDSNSLFPDDEMQAAATIVEPKTGNIIAMVGGRKQGKVLLGLNRATQTTRSSGSTIKPVLDYGPAIDYLNWSTYHLLEDTAYTYPGTDIALMDWDNKYQGTITLRKALANSRNIPAVRTLSTVGLTKSSTFAKNLGITVPNDAGLSIGIGADVSTLQIASAYGAFANSGTYQKPIYVTQIKTADGMEHNYQSEANQAMKKSTAYMITDVLKDVITDGTGKNAKISGIAQAGKTGTVQYSSDEIASNTALSGTAKDAWFAGYTKQYSMAVWVGYDQPQKSGLSYSEQQIPVYLYQKIMSQIANSSNSSDWSKPSSVVSERILTGSNPATITTATTNSTLELFVKGHQPTARAATSSSSSSTRQHHTTTYDETDEEADTSSVNGTTDENSAASSSSASTTTPGQSEQNNQNTSDNTTGGNNSGTTDGSTSQNQPSNNTTGGNTTGTPNTNQNQAQSP